MDQYDRMVEFARNELGLSEVSARVFATGRAASESQAREDLGALPAQASGGGATVPSGLYADVEQSVALEQAAFALTRATARERVMMLVAEKLPEGLESARRALLAHQGRLGGRW